MSVHGEMILTKGEQGGMSEDAIVASLILWQNHGMREVFYVKPKLAQIRRGW